MSAIRVSKDINDFVAKYKGVCSEVYQIAKLANKESMTKEKIHQLMAMVNLPSQFSQYSVSQLSKKDDDYRRIFLDSINAITDARIEAI